MMGHMDNMENMDSWGNTDSKGYKDTNCTCSISKPDIY